MRTLRSKLNLTATLIWGAAFLCLGTAIAQADPEPPATEPKPEIRDKAIEPATITRPTPVRPDIPERPNRPDAPTVTVQVRERIQDRVDQFSEARDQYLERQRELKNSLENATDAQRTRILQALRENRQTFLDRQKEIRERIQARAEQIKDNLRDQAMDRVIDQARERAQEIRERPGRD